MQINFVADKNIELEFTDQIPEVLAEYLVPGMVAISASGTFGDILVQELQSNDIVIRLHHFLLNRVCTFTASEYEAPLLKLRFHLINHIQYHMEGFGNLAFYEQGYNLLYIPFRNNRLHFPYKGVYSAIDIHYPAAVLFQKLPPLVLMNDFQKKVLQQQPGMLVPVNQVASRSLLTLVYQLINPGKRTLTPLYSRCMDLLTQCLKNISEHPVWEPVTLSMHEAQAIYLARTKIEENLQRSLTLKELTQLTGLNDYKLKTGFQQLYHSTPADYLRDIRMEMAWELLSGKKYSVSQVAEQVGYTNLSAFSKAFKKYFNITARERSKERAKGE